MCSEGLAVLIILFLQVSHALYLDSSENIQEKDYTHIKSVMESAIPSSGTQGAHIKVKNKGTTCCVSVIRLTSTASSNRQLVSRMVIHHMLEYRRDRQTRCMTSSSDARIRKWAEGLGAIPDHQLRNEFYRIQQEIVVIIMRDMLEENEMFYSGPISRPDVTNSRSPTMCLFS